MATKSELSRDADAALKAVDARMIEAEKDRAFVEAVRKACDDGRLEQTTAVRLVVTLNAIHDAHRDIYDTPCTASAKTEGK